MRQWISVYLPRLPLETFRPRWSEPGACVVMARERVLLASAMAAATGVRTDMKRGGVLALCPQAAMLERDELREQDTLAGVALSLLRYTPEVALMAGQGLVLDVTRSLRAFGGLRRLYRLVCAAVADLGLTASTAIAPTAQGAWLLALDVAHGVPRPRARRVLKLTSLARRLERIPHALLASAAQYSGWLDGIGSRTLGDLRRLPVAGLKRRTNGAVLDELARAYGEEPELYEWVPTPEHYAARMELPDRIEHAEGLLLGARLLVQQMCGWLMARQRAVVCLALAMEHERGRQAVPPTVLELRLSEPAWDPEHILMLLKERLGRRALAASAIGLRLEALETDALKPPSGSLFPEPGGTPADAQRLLELLAARLGDEAILVPAPQADHRPEVCNRWLPACAVKRVMQPVLPGDVRPFWMFEEPVELLLRAERPFYGSPLRVAGEGERIECGWWDGGLVVRDYFIAHDAHEAAYWIFRERRGADIRWYLHGLFA